MGARRFIGIALATTMAMSLATPAVATTTEQSRIDLVVTGKEPEILSATVPSQILISMDLEGNVTVPEDAKIINNSDKSIEVTSIDAIPGAGWKISSYSDDFSQKETDSRELGLRFRGDELVAEGYFTLTSENWVIPELEELPLEVEAKVTKESNSGEHSGIATVSFGLDWQTPDVPDVEEIYTITVRAGSNGSVTGETTLTTNSQGKIDAFPDVEPDNGYRFWRWADADGKTVDSSTKFTRDTEITAIFVESWDINPMTEEDLQRWGLIFNGKGGIHFSYDNYDMIPENLTLPTTVDGIKATYMHGAYGWSDFNRDVKLKNLVIPSTYEVVGYAAFNGLPGIDSIHLLSDETIIGPNIFDPKNTQLKLIIDETHNDSSTQWYFVKDQVMYSNTPEGKIGWWGMLPGVQDEIQIMEGTTSVWTSIHWAFENYPQIKVVRLPSTIKCYGDPWFKKASGLTDVYINMNRGQLTGEPWRARPGVVIHYNDVNYTVPYEVYNIQPEAGANGSISSTAVLKTNNQGKVNTLPNAIPNSGYRFWKWVDENGNTVTLDTVFTGNGTITAQFVESWDTNPMTKEEAETLGFKFRLSGRVVFTEDAADKLPEVVILPTSIDGTACKSFEGRYGGDKDIVVKEISIPMSYEQLDELCFKGCTSLETLNFSTDDILCRYPLDPSVSTINWNMPANHSPDAESWTAIQNGLIVYTYKELASNGNGQDTLIGALPQTTGHVEIPERVRGSYGNSFQYNHNITSVTIHKNSMLNGSTLFSGNDSITDIYCACPEWAGSGVPWGADQSVRIHWDSTGPSEESKIYTITIVAPVNGTIEGITETEIQTNENGSLSELPSVKPNTGYRFWRWADESDNTVTTDTIFTGDATITPIFVESWDTNPMTAEEAASIGFKMQWTLVYFTDDVAQVMPEVVTAPTSIDGEECTAFIGGYTGNDIIPVKEITFPSTYNSLQANSLVGCKVLEKVTASDLTGNSGYLFDPDVESVDLNLVADHTDADNLWYLVNPDGILVVHRTGSNGYDRVVFALPQASGHIRLSEAFRGGTPSAFANNHNITSIYINKDSMQGGSTLFAGNESITDIYCNCTQEEAFGFPWGAREGVTFHWNSTGPA